MNLVSIKNHRYAGKKRKVGDTYQVRNSSDATLMKALGWAVPEVTEKPSAPVKTVTAVKPSVDTTEEPVKPKRAYKRRDMTAEE